MRKILLLTLLSLISISEINAQEITIKKVFGGYKFLKNDSIIPSLKDLAIAVESNEEAVKMAKNSKVIQTFASISGLTGVGFLGYAKFSNTFHENNRANSNYTESLLVWGASLLIISVPLFILGNQHAKESAMLYNESLASSAQKRTSFIKLAYNENGLGLQLHF